MGLTAPAYAEDTGRITGQLTDGGQPVPYAYVSAGEVDGQNWGSATTDETGHYEIADLPAGQYRVDFTAPGHPIQYAHQQTDWSRADHFTVPAGGQVTVDDELLPTGTISGTFRDRAGAGMAVSVSADAVDGGSGGASGSTAPDGTYELKVLPGRYRVSFRPYQGPYQYAVGTLDYAQATLYDVTAGQTVTVDDTALPTGSVAGRFTDRGGAGIPDVQVSVDSDNGVNYITYTDADGFYRVDGVYTGSYRVYFFGSGRNIDQYAHATIDRAEATLFAVTEGVTTSVDEVQLATGSVHFTVTDARTGDPIPQFEAAAGMVYVTGVDGSATVADVSVGNQWTHVSADGYLTSAQTRVAVTDGATTEVAVALTPVARIAATVVDARTGTPVEGFCVQAMVPTDVMFGDGCISTDSQGKVTLNYLRAGTYQLFAFGNPYEEQRSPYGAQWVTADGGTGNQSLAAPITTVAGQTVAAPVIKLDRRGTITGHVTGTGGSAVTGASVTFGNFHYHSGSGPISFPVAADGTYTVDFLGPYAWPLHFYADGYAPQWSGNSGARPGATKVKVKVNQTVSYDIVLLKGIPVTVNAPDGGWYVAYNSATGETSGRCNVWPAHSCQMLVLGPQKVRFKVWGGSDTDFWYGGTDFATATDVRIPETGTKTVTITR
ncbi:carboxypeptidase-like regulatory domain-containing protein [Catellatospora tritici]|uniref:carboxypeptidase-like regulatory domain-containing protein n=1 Tax=Catellatospora tritici TaxID=2851566 RepID=UPI001C2DBBC0|nr:carboxypeptidase-like regulatory domain-containing protein [Catellatospora tritici]MBV1850094.1 carboxypeptidase-like regulatory domain-containing protein [Catellatospora tritici]